MSLSPQDLRPLGVFALAAALTVSVQAQGKQPIRGTGGNGVFEVTAPTEPMTAEGHGGTGAVAVPVSYTDHPTSIVARALRQNGAAQVASVVLRGNDLVNLALGRPAGSPLDPQSSLVLQIGDDSPASARLAIIDRQGLVAPVILATGQVLDLVQDRVRTRGLLKLQFAPVGQIAGGSVQLIVHHGRLGPRFTFLASGHGHLDTTETGERQSSLLNAITIQAELRSTAAVLQR